LDTAEYTVSGLYGFANVLQSFVGTLDDAMRFPQIRFQPEPKHPRQPSTAIGGNKFIGLFNNNFVHRAGAVFLGLKRIDSKPLNDTRYDTQSSVSPMKKALQKPLKPRKDFPLFPHANGQWCKKIRGKQYFFGVWGKTDEAETEYLRVREYLQAGRKPPTPGNGCRLSDLCNRFLNAKRAMVDSQELSIRTFHDYHAGCAEIVEHFGKERLIDDCGPEDFEEFRVKACKGRGPYAIAKIVTVTRMVFSFAYDNEMIERPIRFGQQFCRPSKRRCDFIALAIRRSMDCECLRLLRSHS
jgi:hypothetical protein